ncbi:hypothetical protein Rs2_11254 [Raphanus sativus]|nr:hypothetical protein Rs2_11254 [Raphanus sativus]
MSLGEIGIIEVLLLCLVGFASGARRFLTLLSSPALPLGSEGSLPCAAGFCVDNIGMRFPASVCVVALRLDVISVILDRSSPVEGAKKVKVKGPDFWFLACFSVFR